MLKASVVAAITSVSLMACSSLPESVAKRPGEVLLKGADTAPLKIMIRTVDNGEVLWVKNYQLGTEAWVAPGIHKVNVMCEFHNSWGSELMPGNIEIDAKEGSVYDLSGSRAPGGRVCAIEAAQRT